MTTKTLRSESLNHKPITPLTQKLKWNLIAGGIDPKNEVVPAGFSESLEKHLNEALDQIRRLTEAGEALYRCIDKKHDYAMELWTLAKEPKADDSRIEKIRQALRAHFREWVRGDTRHDGYRFLGYDKEKNGTLREKWVSQERWEKIQSYNRDYLRKRRHNQHDTARTDPIPVQRPEATAKAPKKQGKAPRSRGHAEGHQRAA